MTRQLVTTIGTLLLLGSTIELRAETVYTAHGPGSHLGTIDTSTGLGSDVGSFGLPGFPTIANSAAFDFDEQGTLYTIVSTLGTPDTANSHLGTIDPTTGTITPVGSPFGINMLALEVDQTGRLLGVGFTSGPIPGLPTSLQLYGDTTLYEIDSATGQRTSLVDLHIPNLMDMAIDSVGTILGTTANVLYTIDPILGTTNQVDITGVSSGEVMGIVFGDDDALYATTFTPDSPLYTIDTTSGVATALGGTATPTGLILPHGGDIATSQTPAGMLRGMIGAVGAMEINKGIANALSQKLDMTFDVVTSGAEHPDAVHRMETFMHFVGNHYDTRIPADDADYLIGHSQQIIDLLETGGVSSGAKAVPEPSSASLMLFLTIACAAFARRRQASKLS